MNQRLWLVAAFWACLGCAGCTSIRSVMLHRDESNTCWEKTRHLPGVPITLKVPTHLQVTVVEVHFLQTDAQKSVTRVALPVPIRKVYTDFKYTERIFTVDFKRPAAGTADMDVTFQDKEQYFKQIKHKVVDETIQDVAALIGAVAPGGVVGATGASSKAKPSEELYEVESVVAVGLFEVDDPNFEGNVSAFLNYHLNRAHDAWVMPPGVDSVRRLPLVNEHDRDIPPPVPYEMLPPP